jgi:hypothetical protein
MIMSKQLDLSQPLDQETIDDLLTRHPVEKVQYWVELSSGSEFVEDESSGGEYGDLTVPELQDQLRERALPLGGNKAELIARLEENDEQQG